MRVEEGRIITFIYITVLVVFCTYYTFGKDLFQVSTEALNGYSAVNLRN